MNLVKIVTDSNAGITQSEAKKLDIDIVAMPFFVDGEEFFEDDNITHKKFFELLEKGADVTTSQPSQQSLEQIWNKHLKTHEKVLYIPMSSGLSGTCENAKNLAKNFGGRVLVADNKRISVAQKESVLEAIAMAKKGKTADEICEYLEKTWQKSKVFIIMSTLKYIRKGGRISPAVAILGELLKVKPVLFTSGGQFKKLGMGISLKQAEKIVVQAIKKDLENDFAKEYQSGKMTISLAYTKSNEETLKFEKELKELFPQLKFHFVDALSLSVACHIGPDAIGIALTMNNFLQ